MIMFCPFLIVLMCLSSSAETEPPTIVPDEHEGDFDSFANCSNGFFELDEDEYQMFPNGTAFVPVYNRMYESSSYYLSDNGLLTICPPDEVYATDVDDVQERNGTSTSLGDKTLQYVTMVGVGVSMACLLVHLVVFAVVKDMRNLPGYNLASLCFSLLMSYLSLVVARSDLSDPWAVCITFAILTQFFFLASFLWMFVISVDVFRSIILATGSLRATSKGFKIKKYLCNSCVSWGTALVFTVAAYLADTLEDIPVEYRPNFEKNCWFSHKHSLLVFFAGPFFVIIGLNFLLFGVSAYTVYSNRMRAEEGCSHLKENHVMYFRLAVITGASWVMGVVAVLVHNVWMWVVFSMLNTLQGFFILLAFTCTAKVRKFFRVKFFGERRQSEQNLTPTFQSYCFYANSLDKDLDKVGDCKEKSGPIDTIVIHI